METEETVRKNFDTWSVSLTEDLVSIILALCNRFNLTAEEFVEEWMAYVFRNSLDTTPTLKDLALLERELKVNPVKVESNTIPEDISDSVSSLSGTKEERQVKRELTSPVQIDAKRSRVAYDKTNRSTFSTYSFRSVNSDIPTKFSQRNDSSTILISFGCSVEDKVNWSGSGNYASIKIKSHISENDLKYMWQTPIDRANTEILQLETLADLLVQKYQLNDCSSVNSVSMNEQIVLGRICGAEKGRLTESRIWLEVVTRDDHDLIKAKRLQLILKNLEQYSLFRGQIAAFTGSQLSGGQFRPTKLYTDVEAPLSLVSLKEPLQIVVVSGPYTSIDDLQYEPLADFVKYILEYKPDVVIMIGPFVDSEHDLISDGLIDESFDELFERIITEIMTPLNDLKTQVVLVPSYRDAHHHSIYPSPPFTFRRYPKLHLVPDPCILDIHGIIVALTSVDVLAHLGSTELRFVRKDIQEPATMNDRMGRLASYLISQRNFYPVIPPIKVPLEFTRWQTECHFNETPHVIMVPSILQYFIKDIKNSLVVNPGVLGKGHTGGTFTRIRISPFNDKRTIVDNVVCEIIKI